MRSASLRWYYRNKAKLAPKRRAYYRANKAAYRVRSAAWRAANPEAARAIEKRYRRKHPLRSRAIHWRKAGIDVAAAEATVRRHDGRCALCGTDKPGGNKGWHLDHCHKSKKVRGVLCCGCNLRLGWFEKHRKKVLRYLR
jgi:hypothetical protein